MFEAGSLIVARETWDGLLWSARPAVVVVDHGDELVHWAPAGTVGCFATSRFFPGREGLSREERQLVSLESRRWQYRGVGSPGAKLSFLRAGSWASVEATWYPSGEFVHWYVNFQRPLVRTSDGYETLDLVIDGVVAPDRSWAWKDREPFAAAIERGLFDPDVEAEIEAEAERVQQAVADEAGPFDARWLGWTPPGDWGTPALPADFAGGAGTPPGATVTLASRPVG